MTRCLPLLCLTLGLAACDLEEPACADSMACEDVRSDEEAGRTPQDPEPTPEPSSGAPQTALCDADVLDGLSCDCGGLRIDVLTLGGEIVSDGEASVVLHAGGTGALQNFDVCRDYYTWEDEGPDCSLVVMRTDSGCGGLSLQRPPGASLDSSACPYVSQDALSTVCTPVEG